MAKRRKPTSAQNRIDLKIAGTDEEEDLIRHAMAMSLIKPLARRAAKINAELAKKEGIQFDPVALIPYALASLFGHPVDHEFEAELNRRYPEGMKSLRENLEQIAIDAEYS